MIQKYWGQPGCLCLHYIKRTNDGAPLPDSSAIFQRMKKGLCTNAYFSLTRQPLFHLLNLPAVQIGFLLRRQSVDFDSPAFQLAPCDFIVNFSGYVDDLFLQILVMLFDVHG